MPHNPYPTKSQSFFAHVAQKVVEKRVWVLIGIGLITGYLCSYIPDVRVNNANDIFFVQNDPALKAYRRFQKDLALMNLRLFFLKAPNSFQRVRTTL